MQKSVQITVYVAKTRITNQEHFSGHRRRPQIASASGGGCRKAQLLLYSQQLRNTASVNKAIKEDLPIVSNLKIRTNQNSHQSLVQIASSNRQQQPNAKKVVPVELQKPVITKIPQRPPSCFSDWRKFFLARFIGRICGCQNAKNDINSKKKKLSVSLSGRMNAVMMSSRLKKERVGVTAKFLSLTGKRS